MNKSFSLIGEDGTGTTRGCRGSGIIFGSKMDLESWKTEVQSRVLTFLYSKPVYLLVTPRESEMLRHQDKGPFSTLTFGHKQRYL